MRHEVSGKRLGRWLYQTSISTRNNNNNNNNNNSNDNNKNIGNNNDNNNKCPVTEPSNFKKFLGSFTEPCCFGSK